MDWSQCVYKADNGAWIATAGCIVTIFTNVLNAVFGFAGVVAVIMIIYSGIKYIMSSGDAKQAESAQKTLTYAVIGLILILVSVILLNVIAAVTGVSCITQFGFGNCK